MSINLSILLLSVLLLLLGACDSDRKDGGEKRAPKEEGLVQFLSFAGINYGDTIDKVYGMYGQPDSVDDNPEYDFISLQFHTNGQVFGYFGMRYMRNSKRVSSIEVQSREGVELLYQTSKDENLLWWGRQARDVLEAFGKPERDHADNHIYRYSRGQDEGIVTFICYEFDDYVCNYVNIQWFVD